MRIGFGTRIEIVGPTASVLASQIRLNVYLHPNVNLNLATVKPSKRPEDSNMIVLRTDPQYRESERDLKDIRALLTSSFEGTARQISAALLAPSNRFTRYTSQILRRFGVAPSRQIQQNARLITQLRQNPKLWAALKQASRHPVPENRHEAIKTVLMDHWQHAKVFQAYGLN